MPKVSIILTSFNHEQYICEAIDSVLGQTFVDFELIIWDDASSDNSWHLINQYTDPRIKAFRNEKQKRGIWGINTSISEKTSGDFIAIHHSDDVWEPEKLEKQIAFLDTHTDIGAVFCNALAITEYGSPLSNESHFYFNIFNQVNKSRFEWLRQFFNQGNALCHPSVMIRRNCYLDCGLYRYGLAQVGDFDMWIRLCIKYEIHVLPDKLIRFRVLRNEANSSGNRSDARIRGVYESYKLLQNYRNIKQFDDLIKVFPEAEQYDRNNESDTEFALAMVSLNINTMTTTKLFALDLLFEIISDVKRAAKIKRLYNFDYKSFIELTSTYDIFLLEELEALNEMAMIRDAKIISISNERDQLLKSIGWRITKPLRKIKSLISRSKAID